MCGDSSTNAIFDQCNKMESCKSFRDESSLCEEKSLLREFLLSNLELQRDWSLARRVLEDCQNLGFDMIEK